LTPPNLAAILDPDKSGSSSVVECFLAKEDVAGSTPVSRSKISPVCGTLLPQFSRAEAGKPSRGAVPKW
jgi:hypothetical protein